MARKQTAAGAAEHSAPPPPVDPTKFQRPAPEIAASVATLAAKLGVPVDLPAKDRYEAIRRAIAVAPKPPKRACHWDVLRGYLRGERDAMAAAFAAEALGLGIKEALRRAADGWTAEGPPRSERVPGEDDE